MFLHPVQGTRNLRPISAYKMVVGPHAKNSYSSYVFAYPSKKVKSMFKSYTATVRGPESYLRNFYQPSMIISYHRRRRHHTPINPKS